ncbi:hypothetical protein BDL97_16G070900 [Sphagnum fallax]|nr:hypothetical protein BDL97_16G070900 [Sphagnum fallax]KAH8938233.1 hypothetical protein BDL97_16G070900 [Sphagnum fallax]
MGFLMMPTYITREVSKIWRRIVLEVSVEIPILFEKWPYILFGVIFQYIHGVGARLAYYLHRPGPLLHDLGFELLPELGLENAYISETVFASVFVSFFLWTFHPFVFYSKRFYTVVLWSRVLVVLVISQMLRVVSFMATQLPGPNYHCREGQPTATLPPPRSIQEVLLLNFPHGVLYGCGDLIFSSHMIFALTFCHTYCKYGTKIWMKRLAWLVMVVLSLLIIASRKHYTVDVVIAWYVVFLVFNYVDSHLSNTDAKERVPTLVGQPLLPMNNRAAKDSRAKDEKLMNGNSENHSSDWRQWMPLNGKPLDNGSPTAMQVVDNEN